MQQLHEMPQMTASSYASTAVNPLAQKVNLAQMAETRRLNNLMEQAQLNHYVAQANQVAALPQPFIPKDTPNMAAPTRRLVQIFIADPDENVSLNQCLLHSGEQQLTDLTDQELFFEVDIRALLESHNAKRAKLVNKAVKERVEYLEPARVRDLKMTVVTIAQF